MWERIRVILRKEFIQALREPRMRVLLFVPPVLQLIVFGFAVNLDVDHARIAWMDMDRTPESRDLRARFEGSRRFDVVALPRQRGRSPDTARPQRGGGRDSGTTELRARFGARPERPGPDSNRRHQLQYGVSGFELRRPDHRAVLQRGAEDAAERAVADAQPRRRRRI